ncbi:MAG: pyridoxal phosphate-dependent aminotransferase family protein [Bacteroidetes bacterium]|nr:pyridoxal phosphate-dependent aminotransferase family protein [Bacteroidota bacterium]MCB9227579.1 pyridoxal phosphate-dependent aminotransferase family protein [Chitinophagales bacterium]
MENYLQDINKYITEKLLKRKTDNAYRTLEVKENLVDFCSNDYLGFARDKKLTKEVEKALATLNIPNGGTGARTITGTTNLILDTEKQIAHFHKAEAALFYNSGFTANLGFFAALPYRGDTILYDELIHASIRDGMQLSRANSYSFAHNNLEALEKRLQKAKGKIYVVVESIYSMDGDAAPLTEIMKLCKKYNAALIVDEAHSNGIFGENGSGLVCELGLEKDVFARVMTFGKAIGSHGAVVVGNQNLINFLINFSRPFIYTTAPPPHQVLGVKYAYDKLSFVDDKRLIISNLISLFKTKIKAESSLSLIDSFSPIQCIIIPGNDNVKYLCNKLQEDDFYVKPIVAPTVPIGLERIRICLHAFNTPQEVERLCHTIVKHTKTMDL